MPGGDGGGDGTGLWYPNKMVTTDLFHQRKIITGAEGQQADAWSKELRVCRPGAGLCAGRRMLRTSYSLVMMWRSISAQVISWSTRCSFSLHTSSFLASCLLLALCLGMDFELLCLCLWPFQNATLLLHNTKLGVFRGRVPPSWRAAGLLPRCLPLAPLMGNSISSDPQLHWEHLASISSHFWHAAHHYGALSFIATAQSYVFAQGLTEHNFTLWVSMQSK